MPTTIRMAGTLGLAAATAAHLAATHLTSSPHVGGLLPWYAPDDVAFGLTVTWVATVVVLLATRGPVIDVIVTSFVGQVCVAVCGSFLLTHRALLTADSRGLLVLVGLTVAQIVVLTVLEAHASAPATSGRDA